MQVVIEGMVKDLQVSMDEPVSTVVFLDENYKGANRAENSVVRVKFQGIVPLAKYLPIRYTGQLRSFIGDKSAGYLSAVPGQFTIENLPPVTNGNNIPAVVEPETKGRK